jgi:transcriptional regulator with XRE-family HTH domain
MIEPDKIIAANVARFRKAKGWSLEDLAKRLRVTYRLALEFEGRLGLEDREQRPFRWSELIALMEALEVSVEELTQPLRETT